MASHLDKTRFRAGLFCATHFNGTRIKGQARYVSRGAPTALRLHAASGKSKQGQALRGSHDDFPLTCERMIAMLFGQWLVIRQSRDDADEITLKGLSVRAFRLALQVSLELP